MYTSYNEKLQINIVSIFAGEYYITTDKEIIYTLLGSCISVCLMDEINNVYGMNHFLLPIAPDDRINSPDSARFGTVSMNLLIDNMLRNGADRRLLKAKIFGGAKVLATKHDTITVSDDNIKIAYEYLTSCNIPIVAEDVGGLRGRKIYFDTRDGTVYVDKVRNIKEI